MRCRQMRMRVAVSASSILAVGFLLATQSLVAQETAETPAPARSDSQFTSFEKTMSAAERSRMFDLLAKDVAELEKKGNLLKRVVRLTKDTVVHIEAKKTDSTSLNYGRRKSIEEAGSGVVVRLKGKDYVLTNRHVIRDAAADQIKIKLADGRVLRPKKTWSDRGTDVALMLIESPRLVSARLGDSAKVEIGDFVVAAGSPFGLSHSITYGIISAKGRRDLELGREGVRYQNFMQTDAAINPGNSGGPLINLRGEVIGINTAIASNSGGNEGIGFTIPINMALNVASQLAERGSVVRAFLGVTLDSKFGPAMAAKLGLPGPQGARISGITPNSPASKSDLKIGDVVLQFGGNNVDDDSHLINLVSLTKTGTTVEVVIYRERKVRRVSVVVQDRSKFHSE
jgi:serine protease Do